MRLESFANHNALTTTSPCRKFGLMMKPILPRYVHKQIHLSVRTSFFEHHHTPIACHCLLRNVNPRDSRSRFLSIELSLVNATVKCWPIISAQLPKRSRIRFSGGFMKDVWRCQTPKCLFYWNSTFRIV
ncbi:hypothetical protein NPIL_126931 [Nephila pilipes]|uniref:Uncharacterized protein n=1 Tax=Nephila pilipes TaxID=299642 RepID=A0A8X6QCQ7_NEPPI|nr:hypothetical protein NPIL_126931 [Nephila pilipes]